MGQIYEKDGRFFATHSFPNFIFLLFSEENQRLKEQTEPAVAEISDENQVEWKSQCIALQEQLAKHQDKLKKKQDSYLQVQTEKEAALTDFT